MANVRVAHSLGRDRALALVKRGFDEKISESGAQVRMDWGTYSGEFKVSSRGAVIRGSVDVSDSEVVVDFRSLNMAAKLVRATIEDRLTDALIEILNS